MEGDVSNAFAKTTFCWLPPDNSQADWEVPVQRIFRAFIISFAAETAAAQDNSVTCPWWIFKGPEGVEEPFGTAFQNYVAGNADRDETKEVLTQLFVDAYDAM